MKDVSKLTAGFLLMDLSPDAVSKLDLFVRIISKRAFDAARKRESFEGEKRAKLASGVLGLDMYKMREPLAAAGLRYVD